MPTTTRIGAAVTALHTAATARPALSKVDVVDGPPLDWGEIQLPQNARGDGRRFLFIGAQPDSDTAAESTMDYNAAGAVSRDETFYVLCTVVGWQGGKSMKKSRDAAESVLAEVDKMIQADPTLGGVVLYSRVATVDSLDQPPNGRGASAPYVFRVACRAYLAP